MLKRGDVILLFLMITLVLTLPSTVNAFGLGVPYLQDNMIRLAPGQSYNYTFTIQNGEDEGFNVSLEYTSELIVKVRDRVKFIPAKSYDTKFTLEILVPNDAEIGKNYTVAYNAKPVIESSGQISLIVQLQRDFMVQIVSLNESTLTKNKQIPSKSSNTTRFIFLGTALMVLIIAILLKIWKISKAVSKSVVVEKPSRILSECKNMEELITLIKMLKQSEYELPEIREIISKKLIELNKPVDAEIVSRTVKKKDVIRLLKQT